MITVGASTIDIEFEAYVVLQNSMRLKGTSLSTALPADGFYPLISAAQAKAANSSASDAQGLTESAILEKFNLILDMKKLSKFLQHIVQTRNNILKQGKG